MKNGQKLEKKKMISAAEYINYQSQIKKGTQPLKFKRLCIIDNGVYIIVNYFNEQEGAPLLGVIQVRHGSSASLKLPDYIQTYREVTDEPQYTHENMSFENFKMNEADKKGINAENKQDSN